MVHRLLYSTALALTLSGFALLGTASAQDQGTTTDPAVQQPAEDTTATAPAEEGAGAAGETGTAPADQDVGATGTDTDMAPADEETGAAEGTAAAPPAEAVIEEQQPNEERADQLLGMTVTGGDGETIGSAEDLLIGDNKEVTGVVISVGGFLGVGSKSVAVNWDEVEVRENPDTGNPEMVVNMTREELEAAPEFKTKEDKEAEAAGQTMQNTEPAVPTTPTTE